MYNFRKSIEFRSCQLLLKRHAHKNYYTALGLTPAATQADIKKAYYDLSMKHHPDKQQGCQQQFLEIVAAYEVLGNLKLRRLYDRGLVTPGQTPPNPADFHDPPPPSPSPSTSYDSRYYRTRSQPSSGRTRQYNFDEWYAKHVFQQLQRESQQQHYNNLRQSGEKARQKQNQHGRFNQEREVEASSGGTGVLLFLICILALVWSRSDIDEPRGHDFYNRSRRDR